MNDKKIKEASRVHLKMILDKYKDSKKDIIELKKSDENTIRDWFMDNAVSKDEKQKVLNNVLTSNNEFIRFSDDAIIVISDTFETTVYKFTDSQTISISIIDPLINKTVAKVEYKVSNIDTEKPDKIEYINYEEVKSMTYQLDLLDKAGSVSDMEEIYNSLANTIQNSPTSSISDEETNRILNEYTFEKLLNILAINVYLATYEKETLITKIKQQINPNTGSKKSKKEQKKNVRFRYIVSLPDGYKPRKLDLAYITEEWTRSGHKRGVWVNVENAEKIVRLKGGDIVKGSEKDGKVLIKKYIAPQTPKRTEELLKEKGKFKTSTYTI